MGSAPWKDTYVDRLLDAWRAAPDAAARKDLDLFAHDQWIPLERGLDVNGMVAGRG